MGAPPLPPLDAFARVVSLIKHSCSRTSREKATTRLRGSSGRRRREGTTVDLLLANQACCQGCRLCSKGVSGAIDRATWASDTPSSLTTKPTKIWGRDRGG